MKIVSSGGVDLLKHKDSQQLLTASVLSWVHWEHYLTTIGKKKKLEYVPTMQCTSNHRKLKDMCDNCVTVLLLEAYLQGLLAAFKMAVKNAKLDGLK